MNLMTSMVKLMNKVLLLWKGTYITHIKSLQNIFMDLIMYAMILVIDY